jgi:hypothetical protein
MPVMNPARAEILEAVNKFQGRSPDEKLGRRHIQQAVCIARHNRLVPDSVLLAAGYRSQKRV